MKKINFLKPILLLVAVFTFSMCEENGEIQFVVVDDFETTVTVSGLEGQTSYTINSNNVNTSDLLDNASSFVAADVESVTLQLVDYSGGSISGAISVSAGQIPLFNQPVALSSTPQTVSIDPSAGGILTLVTSGGFPVTITGTASEPIADNDFDIKMSFKIKATVQ